MEEKQLIKDMRSIKKFLLNILNLLSNKLQKIARIIKEAKTPGSQENPAFL